MATQSEKVIFQTDDGVTIVGMYVAGESGKPAALLLHMMPAAKESWVSLQAALREKGWGSIAIDLRGHGESTQGKDTSLNYKQFSDAEHQASIKDVEAAVRFLKEKGIEEKRLAVLGASIGANLALQYAAEHSAIPAVVLLSPGLDYRGVVTLPPARTLKNTQAFFVASSEEDSYSYSSSRELYNAVQSKEKVIKEGNGLGHGTTMLENNPTWLTELITWLGVL